MQLACESQGTAAIMRNETIGGPVMRVKSSGTQVWESAARVTAFPTLLALLVMVVLASCTTPGRARLEYDFPQELSRTTQTGPVITLFPVVDDRENTRTVGEIERIRLGFWKTSLRPNVVVHEWVEGALIAEMQAAGFEVKRHEGFPLGENELVLQCNILELWYNKDKWFTSDPSSGVLLKCQLNQGNTVLLADTFSGRVGFLCGGQIPEKDDVSTYLTVSLQRALRNVVAALDKHVGATLDSSGQR